MAKPLPLPVWDRQRGKFVCEWMDDHKAHYESSPSVHSRSGSNRQYLPFADAKALAVYDGFAAFPSYRACRTEPI
jgi:hypothetical protein